MQVLKEYGGEISLIVSNDERYVIKQCLNECCYGFRIADFKKTIGADKAFVSHLLDQIDDGVDVPQAGQNDLRIVAAGKGVFKITVSPTAARIFINCMNEAERVLGPGDFPSRFGAKLDEVKAIFSAIESALS